MAMSEEQIFVLSDQVIIAFIWITYSVICQIINVFGIITNSINVICFIKQGFDDSSNVSLLGLAVSDLGSLTTMVWTCICISPAVVASDLPFEPMDIAYLTSAMPHFAFVRVSACITAMITLERCLCITAPLKIKSIITPKRTAVITVCIFIIFIFIGAPVYFVNSFGMKFSTTRNATRYGLVSTESRESVEHISFAINNFVIPFGSFVIIVVCTTILSFKLRRSTKWRLHIITSTHVDKVSGRNKKAARMVVMISSLFIVCFVPVSVILLAMGFLPSLSINGINVNISILIGGFGYMMESINSSMNIFIYYQMSSKYRANFRLLFKEITKTKLPASSDKHRRQNLKTKESCN